MRTAPRPFKCPGGTQFTSLTNFGTLLGGTFNALINIDPDRATFVNHGTISHLTDTTYNNAAVFQISGGARFNGAATDQTFINSGLIETQSNMFLIGGLEGRFNVVIENSGTMTAGRGNLFIADDTFEDDFTLVNSGTMIGGAFNAQGDGETFIDNRGSIEMRTMDIGADLGALLYNDGSIVVGDNGTSDTIMGSAVADRIENTGVIRADVDLEAGADNIQNSGTIRGSVSLGDDADVFNGRGGDVVGTVDGGAGDDMFMITQDGASVDGGADLDTLYLWASDVSASNVETILMRGSDDLLFDGSTGDELILANRGDNVISGDAGLDTIKGQGGNDEIDGGDGDDEIDGGAGNDIILGGAGNDSLSGRFGDDFIMGGVGDDTLIGNSGNDTFVAGEGTDLIITGPGQDVIVFESSLDAHRDRVRDFVSGQDVFDLTDITTDDMTFIGTSAFSGTGAEVRFDVLGTNRIRVEIDATANGASNAKIIVYNTVDVTADDFML